MVVSHNLMAMNAERMFGVNSKSKSKSTEKLSSGYRINRAADDAAGLAISEKMRRMIRGLNQGTKNTQDGISWIQVADGAMTEVHDMLHRMEELAVQSANGTYTDDDRNAIEAEYRQLVKQIDQIDSNTVFNDMPVFLSGNVQLAVSGDPGDLEVFDATYDSNNRLVTYGGMKFHGERISWNTIDPAMVSVVDGKQVFNAGTYTYSKDGYHFELVADDTSEVPYIQRNVELTADRSGIKIDGYQIAWSAIGMDTAAPDPGSYFAYYGGAELEIKIGDNVDIDSIDDIVNSINSKNDGVFEYQWITRCIGVRDEKAVNMYNNPGGNYSSVEIVDNKMAKGTNCNATQASDPVSKLEYTIVIDKNGSDDPAMQKIYLSGPVGGKIAGSEKTLASLGITSWDSGTSIQAGKEYTYRDTSGTGVEFSFKLSDITSFDSVEDGLYSVKLGGAYSTSYDNGVGSLNSKVVVKEQSNFFNVTTFDQEIQLGRDFDRKNYELQRDGFSYDLTSQTMGFSVRSTIAGKGNLYTANLSTFGAQNQIETGISSEVNRMYQWKLQQAINNESTHKTYNQDKQRTEFTVGNSTRWVKYEYDRNEYLNDLDKALDVSMVMTSEKGNSVAYSKLDDYYVQDESGKYISAKTYMENLVDKAIDSMVTPVWKDGKAKLTVQTLSAINQWRAGILEPLDGRVNAKPGSGIPENVLEHVNKMITDEEKNEFDSEAELRAYVKQYFLPGGDYSKYTMTDKVDLYKVKVSFDESKVAFGNTSLDSSTSYTIGRLQTVPVSTSKLSSQMTGNINETIQNYSEYVMQKVADASAYSVHKDGADTKATFVGDEYNNTAVRAYYNSDMLMKPIEKGIVIQHSSIVDDCTTIPQFAINASILGVRSASVFSQIGAEDAIARVKNAIAYVSERRSVLGACQNRLEHTMNNNLNKEENLTMAESRIRDTDMAREMVKLSNHNVVEQVGQSVLAQANQSHQGVLSLLQ